MECMTCGKRVLAENQQYHIRFIHDNKTVKFKIVNDAKQPKLMFSKVNIIPQQDSSSSSDISDRGIPNNNLNVVGSASINNNNSVEKTVSIEPNSDCDDPEPDTIPSVCVRPAVLLLKSFICFIQLVH